MNTSMIPQNAAAMASTMLNAMNPTAATLVGVVAGVFILGLVLVALLRPDMTSAGRLKFGPLELALKFWRRRQAKALRSEPSREIAAGAPPKKRAPEKPRAPRKPRPVREPSGGKRRRSCGRGRRR